MSTKKPFKWEIKFQAELDKRTNEELLEDYLHMVSYVYDSEHQTSVKGRDLTEMGMLEETILKRMK